MRQLTNSAGLIGRVTTTPHSQLYHHGRLRVLALSRFGSQGPDCLAINLPCNLIGRPIDGVGAERDLVVGIWVKGSAVVGGRLALAEIVALDLITVPTDPLPVDLVKGVGL